MKYTVLFMLALYQICISPLLKAVIAPWGVCKFMPSCSEYCKQMIQRFGVIKGVYLGLLRLGRCR